MMYKSKHSFYLLLLAFLPFFYSCNDDSPEPDTETGFRSNILIVNQGNFGQGNGSLDFYEYEQETLTRSIFEKENGEAVGGIIQNVAIYNNRLYIVANNSDKIIVADANTFETIDVIEGFTTPRYISFHGGKAYVSVWGPYTAEWKLEESEVVVVDLADFSILKRIPVVPGPEGIITIGDKIFVGSDGNSLTVIDSQTDAIVKEIRTEKGSKHFLEDGNGKLWASYTSGFLIRFNPDTYEEETRIEIEGDAPQGPMVLEGNNLWFRTTKSLNYPETINSLYRINTNGAGVTPEMVLQKENVYTFNVEPESGYIVTGIASGMDPGTIVLFDEEGNEVSNFAAGVFPHEIIFR